MWAVLRNGEWWAWCTVTHIAVHLNVQFNCLVEM